MDAITHIVTLLVTQVFDMLREIIMVAVSAATIQGFVYLRKLTGITVSKKWQDDLHKAMLSGARAALEKGLDKDDAVEFVLKYVQGSVPSALKGLNPAAVEVLENMALAKMNEAKGNIIEVISNASKATKTATAK